PETLGPVHLQHHPAEVRAARPPRERSSWPLHASSADQRANTLEFTDAGELRAQDLLGWNDAFLANSAAMPRIQNALEVKEFDDWPRRRGITACRDRRRRGSD